MKRKPLELYIHIPFCKKKCNYCDFLSAPASKPRRQEYMQALMTEIMIWSGAAYDNHEVKSIFIGGGTPSILDPEQIGTLMRMINIYFNVSKSAEITIECNPGMVNKDKLMAYRAEGINRLSIGVQSFDDELLQLIGRRHNAEQARQAVAIAQEAGFDNISIDLMYALPSQTMQQWQSDVAQALQLGVQHISSYGLIYEEGTVLTTLLDHGIVEAVDEELEMQMYDYLVEQLTANGFIHYEVSNFALPDCESKHNSSYWNNTPYIGLGAGAHSYNGEQRQWNISDLDTYIQQANAHQLQPETERLTEEQRHMERIMLGLRTQQGISQEWVHMDAAQPYIQQGLLTEKAGRLMATTKGFHILNRIIEDLL